VACDTWINLLEGMSAGQSQMRCRWDSLGRLRTDALQRVPLASDLLRVGLGHTVRTGGVDAAIVRLVGVPKEMRAVRALQGRVRC
jgi:hypothetical protein